MNQIYISRPARCEGGKGTDNRTICPIAKTRQEQVLQLQKEQFLELKKKHGSVSHSITLSTSQSATLTDEKLFQPFSPFSTRNSTAYNQSTQRTIDTR